MPLAETNNEGSLRLSETLFQKLVEEVEDYAILLLAPDGTILNWNRGAGKIKGYVADDIIGRHFRLFYPPEDQARGLPETLLREAAETGKAMHEGWRVRKDGSKFWGSIVITALHDEKGDVLGFAKVTRDLSERKFTEDRLRLYAEELERKNRELEQFAYVASHDLRAPLQRIIAYGNLLEQTQQQLDGRGHDYVDRMQHAAERMVTLIDGLLELARLEAEPETPAPLELGVIVSEVLRDLEIEVEAKNAQITVGPLPTLRADPTQMRQLFQNLLTNSLKFNNKENPRIDIASAPVPGDDQAPSWRITLSDNGIGFEPGEADRIFDLFRRLHGSTGYAGTGIGLALCKKIVERHGGTITAEGEPGVGAVFTIVLPG